MLPLLQIMIKGRKTTSGNDDNDQIKIKYLKVIRYMKNNIASKHLRVITCKGTGETYVEHAVFDNPISKLNEEVIENTLNEAFKKLEYNSCVYELTSLCKKNVTSYSCFCSYNW